MPETNEEWRKNHDLREWIKTKNDNKEWDEDDNDDNNKHHIRRTHQHKTKKL